ncbi:MAG TPA: hypothetical protein VMJ10_25385 [Kofleriaceae bacterium]|nr:hypothetical protein [Kofleriaceae bacterium]
MGRSTCAVLVLACLSAACGHVGFAEQSPVPGPGSNGNAVPQACFTAPAPQATFPDLDVDIAVAAKPDGVAVIWAPRAVGDLWGLTLDQQWQIATSPQIVKPGSWSGTGAVYMNGALVISEVENTNSVKLDVASDDLTTIELSEFGCPDATTIAKQALVSAGSDSVSATGWTTGLTVTGYDTTWAESNEMTVPSATPAAVTATTGIATPDAYVAWSMPGGCVVQDIENASTMGASASYPTGCDSPALVATPTGLALAFEDSAGVELSVGAFGSVGPSDVTSTLAAGASSPRLAFDGTRLWFAYLDATGHAVVGQLSDGADPLATQTVATPAAAAFELVAIDNDVWLFTADSGGMTATMFCLP